MDEQAKLSRYRDLFEAQENLERMRRARQECITTWDRDIRTATRRIERLQNEIRTGAVTGDLIDAIRDR